MRTSKMTRLAAVVLTFGAFALLFVGLAFHQDGDRAAAGAESNTATAPATTPSEEPGEGQKTKSIFSPGLDPKLDKCVRDLQARPWPLLAPAEREKVKRSIADFARAGGRDKTEPKMSDVVARAYASLREVGEGAIPELIDATTDEDPWVRTRALSAIFQIARTKGHARTHVMALFLPVFARSCWDNSAHVRGAALAQLGHVGLGIQRTVIPVLQRGLEDDDETVQNMAGGFLFRLKREELVPEELIHKYGVGTYK